MRQFSIKINDKGFSLIEVIVGVFILAIVAGPLLYSFVISDRISNRSHYLGEATLVSRNIVETVKARSVDGVLRDIRGEYDGLADPDGNPIVNPFGGTAVSDWLGGDGVEDVVWDTSNGVYTVCIQNIEAGILADAGGGGGGATLLDAVITFDANAYKSGDPLDPDINDQLITEYLPMDAILVQSKGAENPDAMVVEEFLTEILMSHDWDDNNDGVRDDVDIALIRDRIVGRYNRTIHIDVAKDSGYVSITVTYSYKFYDSKYPNVDDAGGVYNFAVPYVIYWDLYDDVNPERISAYLFYRPYYAYYTDPGMEPDTIVIDNNARVHLSMFIVKQNPTDTAPFTSLLDAEVYYRARIQQKEHSSLVNNVGGSYTRVYTNFWESFEPSASPISSNFSHRVIWSESPFLVQSPPIAIDMSADIADMLVSREARDRMYDVLVEVYMAGDADGGRPLITFEASHLD